jgi:hypothetical protein
MPPSGGRGKGGHGGAGAEEDLSSDDLPPKGYGRGAGQGSKGGAGEGSTGGADRAREGQDAQKLSAGAGGGGRGGGGRGRGGRGGREPPRNPKSDYKGFDEEESPEASVGACTCRACTCRCLHV